MATKRNKWYKKQLRIVSRSYRVCRTVYISKRKRLEAREWSLKMAKAIYNAHVLEVKKGPDVSLYEVLKDYAQGNQTGNKPI